MASKSGDLGENIITEWIPYESFVPGQRYRIGEGVEIEITKPCKACGNLAVLPYVGKERRQEFMSALTRKEGDKLVFNRRGWYAKVIKEGRINKYDPIVELAST